jgi:hypothetical protein
MNIDGLPVIQLSDLLPGDVLLYDIPGTFQQIVTAFDGMGVNHAALYLGDGMVGEAVIEGVSKNPWNTGSWRSPKAIARRHPQFTPAVLAKAKALTEELRDYAVGQLFLCAGICLIRQSGATDPFVKGMYQYVMDLADSFLQSLQDNKKKPLICSEYVYRSYTEATLPVELKVDLFRGAKLSQAEKDEILAKLAKLSASFVSPGDLLLTPSMVTLGVIDVY